MDYMSMVNSIMSVKNADMKNQVSMAVTRKALDAMEAQGAAVVQMLESTKDAMPASGVSAPGMGAKLDTYA